MIAIGRLVPESLKSNVLYRAVRRAYHYRASDAYRRFRQSYLRDDGRIIADYLSRESEARLHLGCGLNPLPGWLNTDFYPDSANIVHLDATKTFPLPDDSVELIFSEHMIEHLTAEGGTAMLQQCHRVLRPGGRIRISTPSLEALLRIYHQPDEEMHRAYIEWHAATWLADQPLRTPAAVLNDFYRNWGHLFIYDEATLRGAMEQAGFSDVGSCDLNASIDPRLRDLEHEQRMPPGLLKLHTMTLEAVKQTSP